MFLNPQFPVQINSHSIFDNWTFPTLEQWLIQSRHFKFATWKWKVKYISILFCRYKFPFCVINHAIYYLQSVLLKSSSKCYDVRRRWRQRRCVLCNFKVRLAAWRTLARYLSAEGAWEWNSLILTSLILGMAGSVARKRDLQIWNGGPFFTLPTPPHVLAQPNSPDDSWNCSSRFLGITFLNLAAISLNEFFFHLAEWINLHFYTQTLNALERFNSMGYIDLQLGSLSYTKNYRFKKLLKQ